MSYGIRTDQRQRVVDFLGEHMHAEGIEAIAVDRNAGKASWRQVGDTWSAVELESLGEPEALIDAILDAKARGTGKWRIRAYYSAARQPEIRMETVSDAPSVRAAPDSGGAALRDLATVLQRGADNNATRLDAAMDKLTGSSDRLLEVLTGAHVREREIVDKQQAANTTLALAVAQRDAQIEILKMELGRLGAEASTGGFVGFLAKLPPEMAGQIAMGGLGLASALGEAAIAFIRSRSAIPLQSTAAPPQIGAPSASARAEARAEELAVKLAEAEARALHLAEVVPKVKRSPRAKRAT